MGGVEMAKTYIGDGVYVAFDGYMLILTAENGADVTDEIALEPQIWERLLQHVEQLKVL